ncbi:ATP-grasp domain-containing protein [Paenibacillus sp. FSL R10-2796]|uniref:ATP-grasp domain-containing protein n=1 Tax=Paenibacillus sp. FSL R10-2796 TaxID=2954663 RepID=UPI0030DC2B86
MILGANEFQKKIINRANELGYETHVFAWNEGAVAKEIADFFYPISITEKQQILNFVTKINPDGICSIASDLAMPTVNFIANELGLVGNTLQCTRVTTDKFEMRKALSYNNLPCPKYKLVKDINDMNFTDLEFPLIIKPVDRSGSRGVSLVEKWDELNEAINNAKNVSFGDEVLVEEYIDGREFSIEFITQSGKHFFLQMTEKFTTGAPNFIEKGHLSPARISEDLMKKIIAIIEKSLDVLNIENGASHSEVKINSNGDIKIIEIAARMGGDFIGSNMVYISTGFDFLKNTIKVAVQEKIDSVKITNEKMALVGFIFNRNDKNRFELLKDRHPTILKEYEIKTELNNVCDSSSRNGYYILEIDNEKILNEILELLNMEE